MFLEEYDARRVFKENLARLLEKNKVDQTFLVEKTNKSSSTVSDWVLGKKYPRVDVMQKIAKAFNVSIEELIGRPEENWYSLFVRAYERAPIEKRKSACHELGIVYIHLGDDRELVLKTRGLLEELKSGEVDVPEAIKAIQDYYSASQGTKWKHCSKEAFYKCIEALETASESPLRDFQFDDALNDDNYALMTIGELTGNAKVPTYKESMQILNLANKKTKTPSDASNGADEKAN